MSNSTDLPSALDIADDLGIGLAMLPLVSLLQHLAITKFYARKGKKVHAHI